MSDERHEYLALRVEKDLAIAERLLRETLYDVVLQDRDIHAVPWHDEERLAKVAERVSAVVAQYHRNIRGPLEEAMTLAVVDDSLSRTSA